MKKIIALGFYDSIHIGHRFLLLKGKAIAEENGCDFIVSTFDDNFGEYFFDKSEEIFLLEERKEILKELNINNVLVFPTDKKFFDFRCDEFCKYLEKFDPFGIICGKDYKFGKNAEGDAVFLKNYFSSKNINVYVSDLLYENDEKVSTFNIKILLKEGKINEANYLLGRPFFYEGVIKKGRQDGRKFGLPTLNTEISLNKIRIKSGVYVTYTYIDDIKYLSVTNVGAHPSFFDENYNIETHIIDTDLGDFYGKNIKIEFVDFIREIRFFENKSDLYLQINDDINHAKEVLKDDKIRSCGKQ